MASPWNRQCVPYLCRLTCTVQNVCSVVNDAGNSAASRAADVVGRLADSVEEMEMEVERMVDGGDAQRMYEELRRPASQQLTLAHAAARPTLHVAFVQSCKSSRPPPSSSRHRHSAVLVLVSKHQSRLLSRPINSYYLLAMYC